MVTQVPLRIIEKDDSLSEWMFGERLTDSRLRDGDCRTFAVIDIGGGHCLYIALTADFDWICDHCDGPLYTDWRHVVVESISTFDSGDATPSFNPKVSLMRLPEKIETAVDADEYGDVHKLGGESQWLHYNPAPHLQFVGQIAFPDVDDLLLDLDWPTGEMTVEILHDTLRQAYCILWRMHA